MQRKNIENVDLKTQYNKVENMKEANLNLINFGCVILALLTST